MRLRVLGVCLLALPACISLYAWGQSLTLTTNDKEQLKTNAVSGNVYHNPELGFQYQFPRGWSISDNKVQQQAISWGSQFVWGDDLSPKKEVGANGCAKTLLFVSEYPELMHVNYFNPFALLIAADPQCIAGASFPSTVKDQDSIQRIASHLDVYFKTSSIRPLERSRIRVFNWGGHVVFEIAGRFQVTTHGPSTTTMQEILTSTLIMQTGKYWTMCMFVGGDDAQLDELKATRIFFDSSTEGTRASGE